MVMLLAEDGGGMFVSTPQLPTTELFVNTELVSPTTGVKVK